MEALLKTLNQDPSVNVRLASLDALIPHMEDPEVRTGLIRSLGNQDSPLLQMAIAELMIKAQEKQAVPELEKLLQRKDLNGQVAEKLKEGIKVLT
jgi:HEAT repeat protein